MIRIIFFIILLGITYYIFNMVVAFLDSNKCDHCDGLGYWKETRGESNHCRKCDGTGKKQ